MLIQQDVVDLGVVVGGADGQIAAQTHFVKPAGLVLPGEKILQFRLHLRGTALAVLPQRFPQLAIAVHGVVEVYDRLLQLLGRELIEHILEVAESPGALVEILQALRALDADAVIHKAVDPPAAAVPVVVIAVPVQGVNVADHGHFALFPLGEIGADGCHVVHQGVDVGEHIPVDPLENIACSVVGGDEIGLVDMAAFNLFTADGCAVGGEVEDCLFHECLVSFSRFLRIRTGIAVSSSTAAAAR